MLARVLAFATAIAVGLLLNAVPTMGGSPTTRWVDDDGVAGPGSCASQGRSYVSIQAAIDASGPGDTVNVCPGTYVGNLTVDGHPGLKLTSVRPWKATLKPTLPSGTAGIGGSLLHITSDHVTVTWFRFVVPATGDCDYAMAGVTVENATHAFIRSNRFHGGAGNAEACGLNYAVVFTAARGKVHWNLISRFMRNGILISGQSRVRAYRNSIRFFTPECAQALACVAGNRFQQGIVVQDAEAVIRRNVLKVKESTGSTALTSVGIEVLGATVTVKRNQITGPETGISVRGFSAGTIARNEITDGIGTGLSISFAQGMQIHDNTVTGYGNGGVYLEANTASNVLRHNDFSGNVDTDCVDATDPLANTWTDNFGDEDSPDGICTPKP